MDRQKSVKRVAVAAFAATGMQPSQANLFPHSRVRNAQALRDERAYEKAHASGAPTNELYLLRRKALPSMPCLDCGKRMQCQACDKTELLGHLMEEYVNPPPKYDKEIQADVLADMAAEAKGDDETGPTQEELLTLQLRESEQRSDFLRKRIKKKALEMDELQRKHDYQTEELRLRTEERDDFEAKLIVECSTRRQLEEDLRQLHCDKGAMQQEYEAKLADKQREIEGLHAQRHKQHERMQMWLDRVASRADAQSTLQAWWWKRQQGMIARESASALQVQQQAMESMKQDFEEQLVERQAEYTELVQTSQKKQEELEITLEQRESNIRDLGTELSTVKADRERQKKSHAADDAKWRQERSRLDSVAKSRDAELRREKDARAQESHDREQEKVAQVEAEEEKIRAQQEIEEEFGLPDIGGSRVHEARLHRLEESLRKAEMEADAIATMLEKSQAKILYLRRRLHAEVKCHLDSKAQFHALSTERAGLETKLYAQERCIKRQRIPRVEIKCRTLGLKNTKLANRIDTLVGRLGAVKTIAGRSSQKDVRWAIMQAAGTDDLQARRDSFFDKLCVEFDVQGDGAARCHL